MNTERIGAQQYVVLHRARRSTQQLVIPDGYLEDRACRRLVERGLMIRMFPSHAWLRLYALTRRGAGCFVRITGGAAR